MLHTTNKKRFDSRFKVCYNSSQVQTKCDVAKQKEMAIQMTTLSKIDDKMWTQEQLEFCNLWWNFFFMMILGTNSNPTSCEGFYVESTIE